MSVFGPTPIDPRSAQAALAGQQAMKSIERPKPANAASQRMKDAREHRVAGTESDTAVRRTMDEHADSDSDAKRDRRDGKRDRFKRDESAAASNTPPVADSKGSRDPDHVDHVDPIDHVDLRA